MWRRVTLPLEGIFIRISLSIFLASFMIRIIDCSWETAVLLNSAPTDVRKVYYNPYHIVQKRKLPKFYTRPPPTDYYLDDQPTSFLEEDSFYMEPDDALVSNKYSSPVVEYQPEVHGTIPSHFVPQHNTAPSTEHRFRGVIRNHMIGTSTWTPVPHIDPTVMKATVTSSYQVDEDEFPFDGSHQLNDRKQRRSEIGIQPHLSQNNFTNINENQSLVPSDTVIQYQPRPKVQRNDTPKNVSSDGGRIETTLYNVPNNTQNDGLVINITLQPVHEVDVMMKDAPNLSTYSDISSTGYETTTERTLYIIENQTIDTSFDSSENTSDISVPVGSTKKHKMSSGTVAGIVIGVLVCVTLLTSSVIYLLYRKYNGKCTGVVESKFNSDNCGYLDDSLRSSVYLNNHIELPKENSEEMTSLDNDSFLNSLETMTIQNYWADNSKNTKV